MLEQARPGKGTVLAFIVLMAALLHFQTAAGNTEQAGQAALQSGNLLNNPGFEGEYVGHDPIGNIKVAPGWEPWYVEGTEEQKSQGYGRIAEFFPATEEFDHGSTRDGILAQGLKHDFGTGAGGILQQVSVPANAHLRFSAWGRGYSCQPNPGQDCPSQSTNPSYLGMQIGLDPTGGTDFYATEVEFTPGTSVYDHYEEFVVEADAQGTLVTVFIMYYPQFPVERNKVFWDAASLTVTSGGSSTTTTSPTTSVTPVPTTAAAVTTGTQPASTYTVRPGDALWSIARDTGVSMADLINLNGATYPTLFTNPNLIFSGWVLQLGPGSTGASSSGATYVVQPGDYLSRIANNTGASVSQLISLNSATYPSLATNPDRIFVGWVLKLP